MAATQIPPNKKKPRVVEEDQYIDSIRALVRRDYFPELVEEGEEEEHPELARETINSYLVNHTSEDNASFKEIVEKSKTSQKRSRRTEMLTPPLENEGAKQAIKDHDDTSLQAKNRTPNVVRPEATRFHTRSVKNKSRRIIPPPPPSLSSFPAPRIITSSSHGEQKIWDGYSVVGSTVSTQLGSLRSTPGPHGLSAAGLVLFQKLRGNSNVKGQEHARHADGGGGSGSPSTVPFERKQRHPSVGS